MFTGGWNKPETGNTGIWTLNSKVGGEVFYSPTKNKICTLITNWIGNILLIKIHYNYHISSIQSQNTSCSYSFVNLLSLQIKQQANIIQHMRGNLWLNKLMPMMSHWHQWSTDQSRSYLWTTKIIFYNYAFIFSLVWWLYINHIIRHTNSASADASLTKASLIKKWIHQKESWNNLTQKLQQDNRPRILQLKGTVQIWL